MLDQILNFLNGLNPVIMAIVGSGLLDFLFRIFPTNKPFDLIRLVSNTFKSIANILEKIAEIIDKVLPQNVK